jgi:nucleoside-diphosphate-sugar epimerase
MNLSHFFKDDKILITGASGLIGRNLFELFQKNNLNVIGTYYKKPVKDLTYCDLTDLEQVKQIVKDVRYIFLLAAKTYGAEMMKTNPSALVADTIAMNTNVLEAVKGMNIKKIMFVSSSVVYQESFKPLAEEDLDLNKNPYPLYMGVGWVKRYLEKICEFYSQLGLPINIVRPTSIIGKYDKYEEGKSHFVPAIIKRVVEKQSPLKIWGNGNDIKNLLDIDDFIRDMLKVFISYNGVDPFNLCSDEQVTVKEVVDIVLQEANYLIEPIYDITKPTSIPYKSLIRNKFDSIFGKEEYTPLNISIKKIINWIGEQVNG